MDWSKTKTIFILIFLILDLFLVFEINEKRTSSQLEYIVESTIEEQLEADDITYGELPKVSVNESYITGNRKKFYSSELAQLKNQSVSNEKDDWIVSQFSKHIPLPATNIKTFLQKFLEANVLFGDSYTFWGWDKKTNKLLFFQTYKGKPLYFNEHAMISIQVNEDNEMISYEQTFLTDLKEIKEEGSNQEILPPLQAIENLYKKDYLTSGGHITKVELGYYKIAPISGGIQIFVPTWHIVVDNHLSYFVNAIEGQIIEFIQNGVEVNELAF